MLAGKPWQYAMERVHAFRPRCRQEDRRDFGYAASFISNRQSVDLYSCHSANVRQNALFRLYHDTSTSFMDADLCALRLKRQASDAEQKPCRIRRCHVV